MNARACTECGAAADEAAKRCESCGADLEETRRLHEHSDVRVDTDRLDAAIPSDGAPPNERWGRVSDNPLPSLEAIGGGDTVRMAAPNGASDTNAQPTRADAPDNRAGEPQEQRERHVDAAASDAASVTGGTATLANATHDDGRPTSQADTAPTEVERHASAETFATDPAGAANGSLTDGATTASDSAANTNTSPRAQAPRAPTAAAADSNGNQAAKTAEPQPAASGADHVPDGSQDATAVSADGVSDTSPQRPQQPAVSALGDTATQGSDTNQATNQAGPEAPATPAVTAAHDSDTPPQGPATPAAITAYRRPDAGGQPAAQQPAVSPADASANSDAAASREAPEVAAAQTAGAPRAQAAATAELPAHVPAPESAATTGAHRAASTTGSHAVSGSGPHAAATSGAHSAAGGTNGTTARRPPVLASEALMRDLAPSRPARRALRIWCPMLGALGATAAWWLSRGHGLGWPLTGAFAALALLGLPPMPYPGRASAVATVSGTGLALVLWTDVHNRGGFAAILLTIAVTLLAVGLLFRTWHRASLLARMLVLVGVLLGALYLRVSGELSHLTLFDMAWQSWLPRVVGLVFGLLLMVSLLAFMDARSTGGAGVWATFVLCWHGIHAAVEVLRAAWPKGAAWPDLARVPIDTLLAWMSAPLLTALFALGIAQLLAAALAATQDGHGSIYRSSRSSLPPVDRPRPAERPT